LETDQLLIQAYRGALIESKMTICNQHPHLNANIYHVPVGSLDQKVPLTTEPLLAAGRGVQSYTSYVGDYFQVVESSAACGGDANTDLSECRSVLFLNPGNNPSKFLSGRGVVGIRVCMLLLPKLK